MTQVIPGIDHVGAAWLTDVLQRSGALPFGAVESVTVDRVHAEQPHSLGYFLVVRYTIAAPTGAPERLFLKLPRPDMEPSVRDRTTVRAEREVRMYQALAPEQHALPVIPCYDAAYEAEQRTYHLLLADLSATHDQPAHYLTIADRYIEQTVDSLARFHAYWWEDPRLGNGMGDFPDPASLAAEHERLRSTFPAFAEHMGDRLSPEDRSIHERVLAALPSFDISRRMLRRRTLLHGDAHFWNFLYPRAPDVGRTCILDWQSYEPGRGVTDLAYTITLRYPHRTPANERVLVRRYHDRLLEHGVTAYDWSQCWDDYRHAAAGWVLFGFRSWLGSGNENFWGKFVSPSLRTFRELACDEVLEQPASPA